MPGTAGLAMADRLVGWRFSARSGRTRNRWLCLFVAPPLSGAGASVARPMPRLGQGLAQAGQDGFVRILQTLGTRPTHWLQTTLFYFLLLILFPLHLNLTAPTTDFADDEGSGCARALRRDGCRRVL